jgi:hypothetical protein
MGFGEVIGPIDKRTAKWRIEKDEFGIRNSQFSSLNSVVEDSTLAACPVIVPAGRRRNVLASEPDIAR